MSKYKNELECPESTSVIENNNKRDNNIIDKIKNFFHKKINKFEVKDVNCKYNYINIKLSRDENDLSDYLNALQFVNFEDNDVNIHNTLLLTLYEYDKDINEIIKLINIIKIYASKNNYKYIIISSSHYNYLSENYNKIEIKFIKVKDNQSDNNYYNIFYIKINKEEQYKNKYLKYKNKYLQLKKQQYIIN